MKPRVLVLTTEGTNCDEELKYAFDLAGADAKRVHINELRSKKDSLKNYQILAVPGGFSYGDDIVSGKVLAVELTSFFEDELKKFILRSDTVVIGICNGFQVLIRTGLLPFGNVGKMDATLTNNDSGRFECRWIDLKPEGKNIFVEGLDENVSYQVAHGEGKFFTTPEMIENLESQGLVVFRYTNGDGKPTQNYPANPNGSINAIAGITDPTGRILGMMPHPERFVRVEQHPNWRRLNIQIPQGLPIFKNMVKFVKNS